MATYGNVNVDGNLSDWTTADRLDFLPGTSTEGYEIYGKYADNAYVLAIKSIQPIGVGSTFWLDTDRNRTTGYQIFGSTGGAENNINIAADGQAKLYSGSAGQNLIRTLDSKISADGKGWEVAIKKEDLAVSGTGLRVLADVNDVIFLPGNYNGTAFDLSNVAPPARTDFSKKVGIVYSETSANRFFDKKAYSQLFGNAQNQAMQAGINFDILTEGDLKDLNKVVQYDSLVFPYFGNVKSAEVGTIESVLTQASYKYGVGLIAAGDFMTNDENGAVLAGDPYQRLKNLFDVTRTNGGTVTGKVSVNINDTNSPILVAGYAPGEQLVDYNNNLSFSAYSGLKQSGTVLANQTVNGKKYNAVIATQTGGRNVHYADQSIFADSNLGWQAIDWSVYGTQAKVGLELTRNKSLFLSRDDVDQSQFSLAAPVVGAKVGTILADWKAKYGFVGTHFINIGNDVAANQTTDWAVMKPIYQKWLDLGNEIATHTYTHPFDVNKLTAEQLKFEFDQSRQVIARELGVPVRGTGIPGNPESLFVRQELSKYFQYVSGVGPAYTNSFGYLEPGNNTLYLDPNVSFDFNLIDFKKLTSTQAEVQWSQEYAQITKRGNTPFILFPWHDYGITETVPGYTKTMYENFVAKAYYDGTEFVTMDDAQQRIRAFDEAKLNVRQLGNKIDVQITNANNIGKFALDIDAGNKKIQSVTNYYAYDDDSVFTTTNGGSYTINLGTAVDRVTRISSLAQRAELISVMGNGKDLNFSFNGEGTIVVNLAATPPGQQLNVLGADSYTIEGEQVKLVFNQNTFHAVALTFVDHQPAVIDGTNADDLLLGNASANILQGFAGNDILDSQDGNDTLLGGTGADRLYGSNGDDILSGGVDHDYLHGGYGNDVLDGEDGNDFLIGDLGADRLYGANGDDTLFGGADHDYLHGGYGNDVLDGENGNDLLIGDLGVDRLYGANGDDTLFGGADNDYLHGGYGNDVINGGVGSDTLIGDLGKDTFVFDNFSGGVDQITDFQVGQDVITISSGIFAQFKNLSGQRSISTGDFAVVENINSVASSSALIVYSKNDGGLFYNENRTGVGLGLGSQFAVLSSNLGLLDTSFELNFS